MAVYKLSKAGSLIESGYLALAAEELAQGSWEDELQAAGGNLGYQPQTFIKNVEELRRACIDGEVDKAKLAYITTARSLEEYALASNTAGNLKLLWSFSGVHKLKMGPARPAAWRDLAVKTSDFPCFKQCQI